MFLVIECRAVCLLFVHGRLTRKTICQSINFYRRARESRGREKVLAGMEEEKGRSNDLSRRNAIESMYLCAV